MMPAWPGGPPMGAVAEMNRQAAAAVADTQAAFLLLLAGGTTPVLDGEGEESQRDEEHLR